MSLRDIFKNPIKKPKEVMFINPDDFSYVDLMVDRVTESLVYCKKHAGVIYRFFKIGPGFSGKNRRFLAVEGTPLVSFIQEDKTYTDKDPETFLKAVWGDEGYNGLPDLLKEKIKDPKLGITITVKPIIPDDKTQEKFDQLKAEGVLYDSDLDNLAKLGTARERSRPMDKVFDKAPWILAGIGLTYALMGLGVLKGF